MKSCPVCRLFLEEREWRGARVDACTSCGGVWLGAPVFDQAATTPEALVQLDTLVAASAQANIFEGMLRLCPDCRTRKLEPAPVEGLARVVYRCEQCRGVWWQAEPPITAMQPDMPEVVVQPMQPSGEPAVSDTPRPPLAREPEDLEPRVMEPSSGLMGPPSVLGPVELEPPEVPEVAVRDADDAWKRLADGNARFAAGQSRHPRSNAARASEVVTGQHPFAVVVSCSDSRVPPEIVFDQGIGDIFVVRTAGHVLTRTAMGSILYAVDHLRVPLVVVLGHTDCGAVKAAIGSTGDAPAYLQPLLRVLQPVVELAKPLRGDLVYETVRMHAERTAERVAEACVSALGEEVTGRVRVVAAIYDLEDRAIERLPDPSPARTASAPALVPPQSHPAVSPSVPTSEPPPVHDISASSDLDAAGGLAGSKHPRWCPRCRRGFGIPTTLCPQCGMALVLPWFRVPCLQCKKENLIGMERCWNCGADLHPDWLAGDDGRPAPPRVTLGSGLRARRDAAQGCSTSVVLWAVLGSVAAYVLSRLV